MRVDFHDGTYRLIEADKKVHNSDGSLSLYKFETISGYAVPTKLKEIETFAAGEWARVKADFIPKASTPKEPDATASD